MVINIGIEEIEKTDLKQKNKLIIVILGALYSLLNCKKCNLKVINIIKLTNNYL